jgi:hypothetical protein
MKKLTLILASLLAFTAGHAGAAGDAVAGKSKAGSWAPVPAATATKSGPASSSPCNWPVATPTS